MSDVPISMRQRILDAAFDAFMRHGYGGTSTAQIARLAQVSKRDLYALFGSKQAMLADCVAARAERMRRPLALPPPDDAAGLRATLIAFGIVVAARARPAGSHGDLSAGDPGGGECAGRRGHTGPAGASRRNTRRSTVAADGGAGPRAAGRCASRARWPNMFLGVLMLGGILVRMLMGLDVGRRARRRRAAGGIGDRVPVGLIGVRD